MSKIPWNVLKYTRKLQDPCLINVLQRIGRSWPFVQTSDVVHRARKENIKYERKWRTTGLIIHKENFFAAKDALTKVIYAAKKESISQQISQSGTSQKALFNCVDRLHQRKRSSRLPHNDNSSELANMMVEFFLGKGKKDRWWTCKFANGPEDSDLQNNQQVPQITSFPTTTAEDFKKIILKAQPSRQLDPIPTYTLKKCIDQLLPTLQRSPSHHLRLLMFQPLSKKQWSLLYKRNRA